jgi:hypothetical protein
LTFCLITEGGLAVFAILRLFFAFVYLSVSENLIGFKYDGTELPEVCRLELIIADGLISEGYTCSFYSVVCALIIKFRVFLSCSS